MVDPGGIITTVTGTGRLAFIGDGGPLAHGQLDSPSTLSLDEKGLLYVTEDSDHPRVRVLDVKGGTIATFAEV